MESLRYVPVNAVPPLVSCCRCGNRERSWDRIAGRAYCPNCQEMLALGEGQPLVERTENNRCAICHKQGTICFHSFPLRGAQAVAIDLCSEHVRGLIGRRLGPYAFNQLRRQLSQLGVDVDEMFLLHSAFYDGNGRALQPALEKG